MNKYFSKIVLSIIIMSTILSPVFSQKMDAGFQEALNNGQLVNEGYNRCIGYVNVWMKFADPATGLIPRNISDSKINGMTGMQQLTIILSWCLPLQF